ncbi:hypothetical protein [Streptomyces virginiae]
MCSVSREHPREVVRTLVGAYDGRPPKDDATVLCLDWHGPHPEAAA